VCYISGVQNNTMNIFVVDRDPITAARLLPDRHVTKMILESCQMLSLVFSDHYWGVGTVKKVDGTDFNTKRGAFKNHPCTKWVAESEYNCAWLIQHACGLSTEFLHRYGKKHGLHQSVFDTKRLYHKVTGEAITCFSKVETFARAMPDYLKYDETIDDVTAYRRYMNTKTWVASNYLRDPSRRPDWVLTESN